MWLFQNVVYLIYAVVLSSWQLSFRCGFKILFAASHYKKFFFTKFYSTIRNVIIYFTDKFYESIIQSRGRLLFYSRSFLHFRIYLGKHAKRYFGILNSFHCFRSFAASCKARMLSFPFFIVLLQMMKYVICRNCSMLMTKWTTSVTTKTRTPATETVSCVWGIMKRVVHF